MKDKSNNGSDDKTNPKTVESINKKNQSHPVEPSKNKESSSYEEQTLLDGVGSSFDEDERLEDKRGNKN